MTRPTVLSLLLMVALMTQANSSAQMLDRTKRPAPQPTPQITLPAIQKTTLDNGLHVWLVEQHKLPYVFFNLVFQSGADHDPLDRPGIATMTAEALDAGTSTMDALTIADKLNYLGASMSVRASVDGTSAMLGTLSKHMQDALQVFAAVITDPTFPQSEFERLRKQRLTSLIQQRDRAASVANIAFNRIVYGPHHPYGNDVSGTEASISALTREDLVRFYSTHYRPNDATLLIVGDATLQDLVPLLNRLFAAWKKGDVPAAPPSAVPASSTRRVYLIDKPAAPQSEIRIGYPAAARSTPDFFPLQVMNRILGGQFSSRLNMNLRERHGYTYGARSSFNFSKQPGPFVAGGGFISARTDSSLHEFFYEIDRMHKEGITAEELEFSKKGIIGGFAAMFETPMQIGMALQSLVLYNLPDDYFSTYLQNVDRVSLDDVRQVAAKYLGSSKMAVVVVGDVKTVKPAIEQLHLGDILLADPQGQIAQ